MFANPYMLVGLAAAVLPVVVHLLSRARYRSVDWGAMMFLEGTDAAQSNSRRFNQWFLLLIRAGTIALLAAALARPEWHGKYAGAAAGGRRGVAVIMLDCSPSMGFDENGQPRMALAREAAKQLLTLHRGDRVSLVLMGRDQPAADRAPTADLWDVGRRIESAELGYARADVARALDEGLESASAGGGDKVDRLPATFYVVTDRQADNWRRPLDGDEWAAGWKQRMAAAGVAGRVVVIPVGSAESANVLLKSVQLVDGPAVAGQPVDLDVMVQNQGPVQWASVPLVVMVDRGRVVSDQRVNLAADSSATFRVTVKSGFPEAGTHVVSAELNRPSGGAGGTTAPAARPGSFAADDRFDLVVDVRDQVKVLVISGDEPPAAEGKLVVGKADAVAGRSLRAADYLSAALAPFKAAKRGGVDPCAVEVAYADGWAGATARLAPPSAAPPTAAPPTAAPPKKDDPPREAQLSSFDVVVLANLERPTDAQAAALERFVDDGGGLLVAPGDLARTADYDAALFADGAGVLPASLADPNPPDWVDQTSILGFDPSHPMFRFLGGRPDAFLPVVVNRRCRVNRLAGGGRVLMQYATGDPFLIESTPASFPTSPRRGRVLLVTTSLDADWSTLPATGFFVPLVQSAVRYLAEVPPRNLNLSPGELLEIPFAEPADGRQVRVRPPDAADDRPAELIRSGNRVVARYADTEQPGLYQVRVTEGGRRVATLTAAVNPPREESNLTPLSTEQWAKLERSADIQVLDPAVVPISAATALPAPLEIWPFALAGVFVLGLLEMKLSRSWSRTEETLNAER